MKKEKTIRTYQRRTKTGKVVTVKQHTAKYDAAETLKEAAKKKGAGNELEALKKKKPIDKDEVLGVDLNDLTDEEFKDIAGTFYAFDKNDNQVWAPSNRAGFKKFCEKYFTSKEEKKRFQQEWKDVVKDYQKENRSKAPKVEKAPKSESSYEGYGFTKDEFKEWYEGTGSKADKKVEKALKKAMGAKAYNALSDKAADEYKKGGAHRFFTKGLEEMKASTSASTKSVTPTKETKGSKENLVEHYDQFNTKYQGKAVGKPFQFKEKGTGITYDAQFVTDGRGKYGYVVRDSEDSDKRFYVSTDEAMKLSELEPGVRKAAKAAGLTLKKGVWTSISSKDAKTPKSAQKADSSEYGKAPKHLGMTQQEWNDWMDGGANYSKADKKAKAHLTSLYGKDGVNYIQQRYQFDGSNKYIDLVSKAKADKGVLSEIASKVKEKKPAKPALYPKQYLDNLRKNKGEKAYKEAVAKNKKWQEEHSKKSQPSGKLQATMKGLEDPKRDAAKKEMAKKDREYLKGVAKKAMFKKDPWFKRNGWTKQEKRNGNYSWISPDGNVSVPVTKLGMGAGKNFGVPKIKRNKE